MRHRRGPSGGEPVSAAKRKGPANRPLVTNEPGLARLILRVGGHDAAVARVHLDVLVPDVDVEDQPTVRVLEVDLTDGTSGRRLRRGDGGLNRYPGLRQQLLAVLQGTP